MFICLFGFDVRVKAFVFVATAVTHFLIVDAFVNEAAVHKGTSTKGQHASFHDSLYEEDSTNPTIKYLVQARLHIPPIGTKVDVTPPSNHNVTSLIGEQTRIQEFLSLSTMTSRHLLMITVFVVSGLAVLVVSVAGYFYSDAKEGAQPAAAFPVPKEGVPEDLTNVARAVSTNNALGNDALVAAKVVGRPTQHQSANVGKAQPVFFAMDSDEHLNVEEDQSPFIFDSPGGGARARAGKVKFASGAAPEGGPPRRKFPMPNLAMEHLHVPSGVHYCNLTPEQPIVGLTPRILACDGEHSDEESLATTSDGESRPASARSEV